MKIAAIQNYNNYSTLLNNKSLLNTNQCISKNLYNSNIDTINFSGLNAKGKAKQRGLLMHITSLPAERSYCGQFLDPQTDNFINWLQEAKQTHWIMNPLNAIRDDLCPYNSTGRFSRNKFIVNLNKLTEEEYGKILKPSELPENVSTPVFTLDMLEKQKNPRFELAYSRFKELSNTAPIKIEYNEFIKNNDDLWLEHYAAFDVISKSYGDNWLNWDKELQTIPEAAAKENVSVSEKTLSVLTKLKPDIPAEKFKDEIGLYKFEQFLYDKQYNQTVENLNSKGIHLILDLPIGVSPIGVDTWGRKNIFLLDDNYKPTKVSGCPPEGAYHYTQVWGHALYNYDSPEFWKYQEDSLKQILKTADLRLDHFVGYINRAEIPVSYKKSDGTVLNGDEIFKPVKNGGMGTDFFLKEWIAPINDKRSPKGENMFELFLRAAKECGKKPEDSYILENFGPLAHTPLYKEFDKKYGNKFISQRVPIGMGIADLSKINSPFETNKYTNSAVLTGNHDMPSLREYIDDLMLDGKNPKVTSKAKKLFKKFCKKELNLTKDEIKNPDAVFENALKWHYTKDVKQVQTTLQDALGIYWRPNIPGHWNGSKDKFLQKATPEGLLPFWSKVFPKDFLNRNDESGINPGYEKQAKHFVELMKNLYE